MSEANVAGTSVTKNETAIPGTISNEAAVAGQEPKKGTSRRSFFGKMGALAGGAAVAAAGVPFEQMVTGSTASAASSSSTAASLSTGQFPVGGQARRAFVLAVREKAALTEFAKPLPAQIPNTDESVYANDYYIGNFTKNLPHDSLGQVNPQAYKTFLKACTTGREADFEAITLGGTAPYASPQAGLTVNLDGSDTAALAIPPAPTFGSAERAGEAVEVYWHALCRDVPFAQYGQEPLTSAAIADLNKLSIFKGPKSGNQVTAQTLFRGNSVGDTVGPYISQLFLLPTTFGLGNFAVDNNLGAPAQQYFTYAPNLDYNTDAQNFLQVQNGQVTVPSQARSIFFDFGNSQILPNPLYLHDGRSTCALVHIDELYQHYYFAAVALLAANFPANPGSPYSATKTPQETAFAQFGGPHITALMADAALRALRTVWYQKYYVHRTLRPEEYGGWLQNTLTGKASYGINGQVLNSQAMQTVFSKNGSYYLPMAFPEGSPTHPSYGSGHATVGGASVTVLKAFFDDTQTLVGNNITPMYSPDGYSLLPYTGSDVGSITVGGELNKMASNVGIARDVAGVHWRSDYYQSLLLGEQSAIDLLQDVINTYPESNPYFQFTKFDGTPITITKN
ncbi:MAG TPA: vanadium-dependent haloperoxidase [Candidatus Acidoferrales bacterium]